MAQVLTNGTITTQVRLTVAEFAELAIAKAEADGETVTMPDFGEGEADNVKVQIRGADDNVVWGSAEDEAREIVLVLTDEEDDSPVEPEE